MQETDSEGRVTFTTVFPGCYAGRWPHAHFEVFPSLASASSHSAKVATSQLALPQAQCEAVYATTGYDDMRHVAIARLVLDNVAHVQADWARMGAKLSQACLLFGADDIDAVPARDDMPHGPRRAIVEEVRRNLLAASLQPVERTGAFAERGSGA